MTDPRDRFTWEMLREPTLEDYALPPRFLRGEPRHWRPWRPIAAAQRPEPVLLSLTRAELAGVLAFALTIGFCFGYFCAFMR